MANRHTAEELALWQKLPLSIKVRMTQTRIRGWVDHYGEDGVYVSFSGGKDSTVLLDIVRKMGYTDIPAVFVDVPTQYPELREFAKTFDNVVILYPQISFIKVCEKYGFPLISKEVSGKLHEAKLKPNGYAGRVLNGSKKGSRFDISRWAFMLDAPFSVHNYCCNAMKKNPIKKYEKSNNRVGITAQMASESKVRTTQWLIHGCNGFDRKRPISNPMSFWTDNDVLQYIVENKLPICSVYGDVVEDFGEQVEGQMSFIDCDKKYKTTGCKRTGCMLCGFGCHLDGSPSRFEMLRETHYGMYKMLDTVKNNGVTMREAIDWINEHGDMNIKY